MTGLTPNPHSNLSLSLISLSRSLTLTSRPLIPLLISPLRSPPSLSLSHRLSPAHPSHSHSLTLSPFFPCAASENLKLSPAHPSHSRTLSPFFPCAASENLKFFISGKCIDEASFNLGIGVGLAFLIANSKNEFHKLKELQTQMEMLLGDIKNEMRRKDMICPDTKFSKNNLASNSNGSECIEDHLDIQSHGSSDCLLMELSTMECGQFSKSDLMGVSAKGVGMDQLEAELEAELECLQLKLDAENTSELRRKKCMKMTLLQSDCPCLLLPVLLKTRMYPC